MPSLKKQVGDKHPKAEEVILFDEEREQQLLEEANVAIVFGAAFGLSPCFRVSYAASEDTLKAACARIAEFCAALT